jgi:hypothetical protein
VTVPITERSTEQKAASLGWRADQVERRPSPAAAKSPGLQYFTYWGSTTTSGGGMAPIAIPAWTGPNDGVSVGIDSSGNSVINSPGVYALAVHASPQFVNPGVDTTTQIAVTKLAGIGLLLSASVGTGESAFAEFGTRINQLGTGIDMNVPGDFGLHTFAVCTDTTVPPVVQIAVNVLENLDSVARQVIWRVTWVRLGDPYTTS